MSNKKSDGSSEEVSIDERGADEEAVENARRIEKQRIQLIEERWLSTHVLAVHLEIESMLETILRQTLPKPDKFLDKGTGPSFAQKLSVCDALDVLDENLIEAVRALNRLRNSYAHTPNQELSVPDFVKFISAINIIHPVSYQKGKSGEKIELRTYEDLLNHCRTLNKEDIESMLFISLKLLRANLTVLFSDEPPESNNADI